MAQPTNTFDTYDSIGNREDLSDVIYNVAPYDVPFLSKCSKVKATAVNHEWQTDTLDAASDNKHVQGDDTTAGAITPTVRLGNYTQIMKKSFTISATQEAIDKAGRGREEAYQTVKKGRELKKDMELAMFANNAKVAGSSSVAAELAGVPAWLTSNTDAGTGGADASGTGADARTDGTARDFTETQLTTVLQSIWENGGDPNTIYLSATNQTIAAGFQGNAPRRHTDTGDGSVNNFIDIYVTNWGRVEFMPSRQIRSRDVLVLQDDMFAVAELRPIKSGKLAKTGDSDKYEMVAEFTMESRNEAASGGIFDTNG